MGQRIPPPRLTVWAAVLAVKYIVLPIFGLLLILDIVFYLIFRYGLDRCYGILCLMR